MYGAVCDDTVGFFAVLTKDEPDPARIGRAFGIEARGKRSRTGVRMVAAEDRRSSAPRAAMRAEERGRIDLEVPQPFICDVPGRDATFDPSACAQQQPARFFRRPERAVRANFRKRLPCNSKHHANIAIQ